MTDHVLPEPRDDRADLPHAEPGVAELSQTIGEVEAGDARPVGDMARSIQKDRAPSPGDFATIAQQLMASTSESPTVRRVVDLVVETVERCHYAGVSLRHGNGRVDSPACTDDRVAKADALQYELQEGPCLDAIRADELYVVRDLTSEWRWPSWAPAAAALGFASIVSVRLSTAHGVVGALNLYSRETDAFDEDAVNVACVFAMHAANALWATQEVEGLRTAMRTRHLIGMAQGVLMERHGLSEDAAFEVLRRYSQIHNVKLREVASQVLERRNEPGPPVAQS
ncbi:MAG TPA: GAF and ANTAR domain-containing protein [Actinomycetales bacterium]|nr:GAF and ANTAR domain-containing protein [Actinomycetales bacterium]